VARVAAAGGVWWAVRGPAPPVPGGMIGARY